MLTRRAVVAALAPLSALAVHPALAGNKRASAPGMSPDAWMSEWMRQAKDVQGGLYVGRFADPVYFLTKPISWKPNPDQRQYEPVTVPVGFVTDFASIPRAFWSLLRPDGTYAYAAVIHDYLYWTQQRPRDQSDLVLKFAMQDFKIDPVTVTAIYRGVRVGGGTAWASNARLKAGGERRLIKRFPDDPRTRWDEWKTAPDVF